MSDEEDDETVSSIVNTLVDQTVSRTDPNNILNDDDDEMGLAERLGKRSLTMSTVNLDSHTQQIKRLRSNTTNANISI